MQLVIIFGPAASGKMTVGQELAKLSGLKLFHNHMSIDLVHQFFDFGTPEFSQLDKHIRFGIFETIAKSKLKGVIFTMVWAINEPEDEEYADEIIAIFERQGAKKPILVELKTDLEERLKRNKHPHRLEHKPLKRDLDFSEKVLLYDEEHYQTNTKEGDLPKKDIFKIHNTNITAVEAAQLIQEKFDL